LRRVGLSMTPGDRAGGAGFQVMASRAATTITVRKRHKQE